MIISTNDSNNISNISHYTFNRNGNDDITSWLHQNNNWLIKFNNGRVMNGDITVCSGAGAMWKVNNKVYCWMESGALSYTIVDVTSNNFDYSVNGKYGIFNIL